MLDTFLKLALENIKVVREAPIAFAFVLIFMSLLIFATTQWHFSGEIDTLNSRIAWQDDQLTDYRNRLHGASPEQAASQIAALNKANTKLQSEIDALRRMNQAPHLTEQQQSGLKRVLGAGPDISAQLWIVSYPECFRCRAYAWEFAGTLNEIPQAQWNHKVGVLPGATLGLNLDTSWRGPIIGARNPKHLNKTQALLVKALGAAGIPFSFKPIRFFVKNKSGAQSEKVILLIAPEEE